MSLLGTLNPNLNPERTVSGHGDVNPDRSYTECESLNTEDTATSEKREDIGDEKKADAHVSSLARHLTHQSTRSSFNGPGENSFLETNEDSELNPHSPNFNARRWVKNLLAVKSQDPERYPERNVGVLFRDLSVHGFGSPTDYQKDVANSILEIGTLVRHITGTAKQKIQILQDFDGVVRSGEMLVVLGRPGSGCSTFLKTIAGEMNGIYLDENSHMNYGGIPAKQMRSQFRGEAIYTAETDVHFPQLSVADTLKFAALARAPRNRILGVSREQYAEHMRDVVMTMLGLSHTKNTRVGNDFVRGVSGGERKRVTIAEAQLNGSPIQCWDNSTRGLDSANALEFCKTLRLMSKYTGTMAAVAIYQASQNAYNEFDKVTVLYEGRQIYFGRTDEAKEYFTTMGYKCPERQTTADFLTSLTSPNERIARPGFENRVPRTPDEFAAAWKQSEAYKKLRREMEEYEQQYPLGGETVDRFVESRKAMQAKGQRTASPYTLSIMQQINLCTVRGFQRLKGDFSLTLSALIGNFIMALVIASVYYNMQPTTDSFFQRGALIFFAVLLNAFGSALEILTLYAQRPIVEKQARYAMYHPFTEAIASMLCDTPYKLLNSVTFNIPLYFLANLRREPGAYFTFHLFSLVATYTMSMLFRTMASVSRTLSQALVPAAILILALVIYTGFALPIRSMLGWSRWINYLDPIAYAFESLMVNEFHGREFTCSSMVPPQAMVSQLGASLQNQVCSTVGSTPGSSTVNGDQFLINNYQYYNSHKWRNLGIIFAFMAFFCFTYLAGTEYISESKSKGEVLVFRRGHMPPVADEDSDDVEANPNMNVAEKTDDSGIQESDANIQRQTAIFHWQDVCYDINIKGQPRRILDHVDGWVKPGTCTALMGVSGAGKTTLLDVLATRVTTGVVTGEMLVDGRQRDESFQRKTGYVQQQDLHLPTSTVREALEFSAVLRQPAHVSRREKLDYADEVIKLLGMESYADAVVGVPGEGLNVEQRKRLTIGVELAAKPQLLLFLDEPTSGLDSQTSWSILDLIDTLTKHGQAILCTIHQPSAMLFQRFDRLLLLAAGGKTVYFGQIGDKSRTFADYFERNGAHPLPADANPAEWMLEVIGAAPNSHTDIDWPAVWRDSPEHQAVIDHLAELKSTLIEKPVDNSDPSSYHEFAAPFGVQVWECTRRVFSQYWRSPIYIYSKITLCVLTSLFIGFSLFKAKNSQQGLQNQMFGVFMLFTIFGNLVQQIMPHFVTQRSLYEARERPSKAYSWKAFMIANITVELPWNSLMSVIMYFCWYYPIGFYRNAPTGHLHERGALMFLFVWAFLLFTSTFAHAIIAGIELAETGGNIANLLFSLCLIFCGVLATPQSMPHFWIFMYRVSPFTYLVSGMLAAGCSGGNVVCEEVEYLKIKPPGNQTCTDYLGPLVDPKSGGMGYIRDPNPVNGLCHYCPMSRADEFLAQINSFYKDAWRNFGLIWVWIAVNACAAVFIYWLARVPKGAKKKAT